MESLIMIFIWVGVKWMVFDATGTDAFITPPSFPQVPISGNILKSPGVSEMLVLAPFHVHLIPRSFHNFVVNHE